MRVLLVVRTVQFEPSFVQSILCVRTTRPTQTKTFDKKWRIPVVTGPRMFA